MEARKENTKKKQEDLWRDVIYSSDSKAIDKLLNHLRNDGNTTILPDIFNIYKINKSNSVGNSIYEFLCDLKSSEAIPIILEYIKNPEYSDIKKELLTLTWQTSLDFSLYLDYFIDIFIRADLQSAFEAFTAIEYFEYDVKSFPMIDAAIDKLQLNVEDISIDKKELLVDLVNILRKKQK